MRGCQSIVFVGLVAAVASGGCKAKVHLQRVQAIDKVAIVEYQATINQRALKTPWLEAQAAAENAGEQAGNEAYAFLAQSLATEFGWSVMPRTELIAQPVYQALYAKYHQRGLAGFVTAIETNNFDYRPGGILRAMARTKLDPSEQRQLLEQLGLDGIVVSRFDIDEAGKTMIGRFSVTNYRATARYALYDKNGWVWTDTTRGLTSQGVHRVQLPVGQQDLGPLEAEKAAFFQAIGSAQEVLFMRFYQAAGLTRPPPQQPAPTVNAESTRAADEAAVPPPGETDDDTTTSTPAEPGAEPSEPGSETTDSPPSLAGRMLMHISWEPYVPGGQGVSYHWM